MRSPMKKKKNDIDLHTLLVISKDRERTNLFRHLEQRMIAWLVIRIPHWISSNQLTAIGYFGNVVIFLAFVAARYLHPAWLLMGLAGFFINWFGDSLDGRIAYFRNKPRKWYGFALDLTVDWLGIIIIGSGFIIYAREDWWYMLGFIFVVLYGWEMITALLRYKISNQYSIDSGWLSPTEVRIIISIILVLEVLLPDSIYISTIIACIFLFINNIIDTTKLLRLGNQRDREERENGTSH